MSVFALATGLRRSNVTDLLWDRIDMTRCCCYVPGYESKSGEPIPVPLNDDTMDVLRRWQQLHEEAGDRWSTEVHRYVFVYRCRAPIEQVATRMWRREAAGAVGLSWATFHKLRHAWAS
jgi:integrase